MRVERACAEDFDLAPTMLTDPPLGMPCMATKLTVKEAKLLKAKSQGKTHVQAWDEAGYSKKSSEATKIANTQKILSKPKVQKKLSELMDEEGIGDRTLLMTLKEGLQASKTVVMGKEENSFVDIQPDHATRHKYLETGLRLRGHGPKADQASNTIIFNQGDLVKQKYVKD